MFFMSNHLCSYRRGFPHASIDPEVTTAMVSSLYDRTIDSTLSRLAYQAEITAKSSCNDDDNKHVTDGVAIGLVTVVIVLAVALVIIGVVYCLRIRERKSDLEKPLYGA
jgi:hypothetical protein